MRADGTAVDWPWQSWGSDQAKITASDPELTADYQVGDVRVVIIPAYAAAKATAALPVAVDPETAARAGATGRVG